MSSEHEGWLDKVTTPRMYDVLATKRGVLYGRNARGWRLPVGVAVLGLGLASAGQLGYVRPQIERQLHTAATAALTGAGFGGMQVYVDGRDVSLEGTLPTQADIPKAIALVQAVRGVRVIKEIVVSAPDATGPGSPSSQASHASAAPPSPAASTRKAAASTSGAAFTQVAVADFAAIGATIDDATVTLVGAVPSTSARTALVERLAGTFGAAKVVDRLVVDAGAGGYGLPAFAQVVTDLGPRTLAGAASMHSGRMAVAGVVRDDSVHRAIAADAVGAIGSDPAALSDTVVADPAITTASDGQAAAQLAALPPIPFAGSSSALNPAASRIVAVAAAILLRHPRLRVQVQGHTDAAGDAATNLALSRARASAVVRGLQAARVPGLQLTASGFGATRPIAGGTGPLAAALNRRVVFVTG